jgi:hypothetical protein
MASDPLPSASNEAGEDAALPSNAEDRKAAEAMSKLEDRGDDDGTAQKEVDAEALGKAMKNLAMGAEAAKAAELKKKVKVETADVTLVVSCPAVHGQALTLGDGPAGYEQGEGDGSAEDARRRCAQGDDGVCHGAASAAEGYYMSCLSFQLRACSERIAGDWILYLCITRHHHST